MKKVLIGSVLTLVSSLWAIAISVYVQLNLVMDWYGSRFWASAKELGGRRTAGRVPDGVDFGIGDPGRRVFSEREIKAEI